MVQLTKYASELWDSFTIIPLQGIYIFYIIYIIPIDSPPFISELLMKLLSIGDRVIGQVPNPFDFLPFKRMGKHLRKYSYST